MSFSRSSSFRLIGIDHGVNRHLFSIKERQTSGDLIITVTDALGTESHRITQQKYSVHDSPKSEGTLFTYLQEDAGMNSQRLAAFVSGPRERLCWPIAMHRLRGYDQEERHRVKNSERVFILPPYDSFVTQIFIGIVVLNIGMRAAQTSNWALHQVNFSKFSVAIYYQWTMGLSDFVSGNIINITSAPTINGVAHGSWQIPASPMPLKAVRGYLTATRNHLLSKTAGRLEQQFILDADFHGMRSEDVQRLMMRNWKVWNAIQIKNCEAYFKKKPELWRKLMDGLPEPHKYVVPPYFKRSGDHSLI